MKWRNRKESVTLKTKWNHQDHLKVLFFFLLAVGPACEQNLKMESKELEFSADKET